ncbi:MAG: hypothetical protein IJP86_03405 [Synergistaceae bacterium]|nr:hypothetical protein [Synergistaceae bacterium]
MPDGVQTKRGAKNTIFLDLFSIPKYRLEMVRTLHPEMTDLEEDDIKTVTLNPVILNGQYNDLALLVRDKLIIFAEAQSTWSINILVRILLYLAGTYQEYITVKDLNVYSSKKLAIPEPEFYVIYTGSRKAVKDIISLREDFWDNVNLPLDLRVKVIRSEDKGDIIGQYIIFAHVLDSQIKIHGRTKLAAENTIRICQDSGVLKEYLDGRRKEVVDIMVMLFDQDYAMGVYGRERERIGEKRGEKRGVKQGKIQGVVEACRKLGATVDDALRMIMEDFGLSQEAALRQIRELWGN